MTENSYQLSKYELPQLERIKKNDAYLDALGLHKAKQHSLM